MQNRAPDMFAPDMFATGHVQRATDAYFKGSSTTTGISRVVFFS